ncbi:MBL fold metallo-hydrolase [Aquihabitans sp. G128]|uniref:MBL fold metallo-hydrolase n=1 Tax=Aquihabitans sp. G128 TaxID=2849779 RepID=UPI001C21DA10|nr:MBL fold metallo-hydrolase [Aquihabitans sp. G128]QXC60765.1 MBL fold metallo-hydrolase [Aquihabitans sp. G128]
MDEHAHEVDATVDAGALHEVVDGVFAWIQPDGSWWVNNAGAVTGDDGTVVIDTCATAARTRRFLDAVRDATDGAPITVAANTHEHGDHTYGNSLLPATTALIGHERMRAQLLVDPVIDGCPPLWAPVPDWGAVTRRAPTITTRSDLTVHTGTRRIDLVHPGYAAHTTGDLVAWLPDERVLFTGDLVFSGLTPLVMAGSVDGALRSLDWLATFEPDHLVPGHGPLVTASTLADVLGQHERYYRFVLATAANGRRDGLGPLDAARRTDLGPFADWLDAERLLLNLHRAYADAEQRPFDIVAAFGDALTWNGGPLTTHVCCAS